MPTSIGISNTINQSPLYEESASKNGNLKTVCIFLFSVLIFGKKEKHGCGYLAYCQANATNRFSEHLC